ncbi:MFS transporter [Janthinobacterium sp. 17J80-10]|uniref:MFS transporter n=1 Tax=Janthinobacterium sp. 17J80-10 TaxID=2497863 RepID=UPI001005554C|nr:MFS transporter [Janthinobacterium sp. 17J80-10]QAU34514.1 MFS transporter [Janthinobacterium sp. 17J80-10]
MPQAFAHPQGISTGMTSIRKSPPPVWVMLATGLLVVVVALVFARLAYGLILPFMRESLGLNYQQAGNLGTAAALGYLCLIMASGVFAARWGGQITIVIGVLLTAIGFCGLSLSSHYLLLVVWMTLLGFGTAFSYTPTISLLVGWFPQRRAAVIGAVNSGAGIGMLLVGAMVPYLQGAFGDSSWRLAWGIFALAGMLTAAAVLLFLPNPAAPDAVQQQRTGIKAIYRNREVIRIGLLYAIIGSTYVVQAIFMYSFALAGGLSPVVAGRLAAMSGILSIFSGPLCGALADRFGRRRVIQLLVFADLIGTGIPLLWPGLPGFALHYIIIGATMSGLFTVVLATTTEAVSAREASIAVSYVTMFYAVAQLICPAAAGLVIERSGGFSSAFTGSVVLIAVAFILSWHMTPDRLGGSQPAKIM